VHSPGNQRVCYEFSQDDAALLREFRNEVALKLTYMNYGGSRRIKTRTGGAPGAMLQAARQIARILLIAISARISKS
jgi:hypothetical protein